eukprot:TRINITY_DN4413_c0_g1_i1.p1 TRINITY_DN4413_c0_g1~~TRINITY_DN4413_c0_g1_i1.p1  ORF type:complete len:167 (+),score=46.32 TRINITY_DN4413_c0_g1_i1:85-585(+)
MASIRDSIHHVKELVRDKDSSTERSSAKRAKTFPTEKQSMVANQSLLAEEHKMVMVARMDLKMGAGKIAAQCCHACLGATLLAKKSHHAYYQNWIYRDAQAKVVVKSPTLDDMEVAQAKAQELDIPFYLVRDAGRTQIAAGSATVLAVGPAPASVVDQVTGNFRLY